MKTWSETFLDDKMFWRYWVSMEHYLSGKDPADVLPWGKMLA